MADTKTCTRCGEEKDIDEFYKGHGKCKPCYKEHQKERQAAKKGKKLKRSKPKTSGPAQTTSPPRSEPDPPLSNANGWTIPDDPRLSELEKLRVVLTDALDIDTIELTLDDAAKVSAAMVEAFNQEAADVSG